ncbi:hypothetical protein D3C78_1655770 [compost metagenome]
MAADPHAGAQGGGRVVRAVLGNLPGECQHSELVARNREGPDRARVADQQLVADPSASLPEGLVLEERRR